MTKQPSLVFVYGTLRKGSANHGQMRSARFMGKGKTAQPFALYLGDYPYVFKNEPLCRITGEVYAVDAPTLARLDAFEDHPDVYRREQTEILLDSGECMSCWLYFYPRQEGQRIPSGDFCLSCCDSR